MPSLLSRLATSKAVCRLARVEGKGGGDEGVIQVRGNFPDTAYWNALVTTDSSGQASVSVTLPDNLTTWRMDARAVTQDTLVGQTIQDLVSTRPLLVRPQTPRFFVEGDQATIGVAVHNNTGADQLVDVTLDINGVILGADATQQVEIANGRQAYVTWPVTVASGVIRVDMVFSAQGGGFRMPAGRRWALWITRASRFTGMRRPETVGTSGQMLEGGHANRGYQPAVLIRRVSG